MIKCAFDREEKCTALTVKECEKCTFRKSKDELDEGRERAKDLLERLPREQREAIYDKYYRKK